MKVVILKAVAVVLFIFAIMTLFMSGSVIFDLFGMRAKEGNFVPFIVGANFICSLLYLPAAYGFFAKKKWTPRLLVIAAGFLAISFIGLLFHINSGGLYEERTVRAMLFRISVTGLFAVLAWYFISKKTNQI